MKEKKQSTESFGIPEVAAIAQARRQAVNTGQKKYSPPSWPKGKQTSKPNTSRASQKPRIFIGFYVGNRWLSSRRFLEI